VVALGLQLIDAQLMRSIRMFNKYPEQKQSRTVLGALGAALLTLGIFLVVIDAVGGFIFVVAGGGLVMLAWVASERTFERVLRVLNWL
jgi:uncharacterized membrane protein